MNDGTKQEQDQTLGEQGMKQDEMEAANKLAKEQHDKRRDFHRWQELYTMALMGASMNQNEAPQVIAHRASLIATAAMHTMNEREPKETT